MAKKKQVLFYHFPKTGGTTLSHILQREVCGVIKNLIGTPGKMDDINISRRVLHSITKTPSEDDSIHCILRGWRDWKDVIDNRANLGARPAILLEGYVWGLDYLLAETHNTHYVTTIRDPFSVFRSNYSYSKQRYAMNGTLGEYVYAYGNNLFTNALGHGDLSLAKERLEHFVSSVVVLETYDNSLSVLADRLGLANVSYGVRNKSASERFSVSDKELATFKKLNSNDYHLYDYAYEMVNKRYDAIKGSILVPQIIDDGEFPEDHVNKNEAIISSIDRGDLSEATKCLEGLAVKDFGTLHNLGKLLFRQGKYLEARQYFEKAFAVQPAVVLDDFVNCLVCIDTNEAIQVLASEVDAVFEVDSGPLFDSGINRDRVTLAIKLVNHLIDLERSGPAVDLARKTLSVIDGLTSQGGVTPLWGVQKDNLLLKLSKQLFKIGSLAESRRVLGVYKSNDRRLLKISLTENLFIFILDPFCFLFEVFMKFFRRRKAYDV